MKLVKALILIQDIPHISYEPCKLTGFRPKYVAERSITASDRL
jgi:hypothetical protein